MTDNTCYIWKNNKKEIKNKEVICNYKNYLLDLSISLTPRFAMIVDQQNNGFHLQYENNVDTYCKLQHNKLFYTCERNKMRHVKK